MGGYSVPSNNKQTGENCMKTFIFFVVVLVSGYYLLSKTDEGFAILNGNLLARYLPHQQIENASDTLLKNVDNRLQEITTKLTQEQKQGLAQLEEHINALSDQLDTLKKQQTLVTQRPKNVIENKEVRPDIPASSQHTDNKAVPTAYAEQTTLVQNTSNNIDDVNNRSVNVGTNVNADNERKTIQRQKQASLQFITSRMEQLSVEIGSGSY
jgi:hypothetical protein